MKLPKLYRKVYLKFEWIIDSLQGGEHHQDWGFTYIPSMRVLDVKGNWFWRVIDWYGLDEEKEYFDKYSHHECDGWDEFDLNNLDEDGQLHLNYHCCYNRLTIKERNRRREPVKETVNPNPNIDWDLDIPF